MIRVGIIGTGYIADEHAKGYQSIPDRCRIIAVADIVEDKAKQKCKEWGADKYYTDYTDLLDDEDIDAVSICLPHHLHAEACIKAAEANKHILVEKPFTRTVKEADEVCRVVQKRKVKLMVAHNQLFFPAVIQAKKYLDEGYLGTVTMVNSYSMWRLPLRERSEWGWRLDLQKAGGGTLIDTGMHRIYLARYFGGEVEQVAAHINNLYFKEIVGMQGEDTASVIMKFKNGALGLSQVCIGAYNPSPYQEWVEIYGTEGSIKVVTGYGLPHLMMNIGNELLMYSSKLPGIEKSQVHLWYPPENCYIKEVQHFIDCIVNNRVPLVTEQDGRACIEIVEAAYNAANKGITVKLP